MLEKKPEMLCDGSSKTFYGVYFVLLGFDLTAEEKIRSKLVDGGGVDVGRCGPDCTHVIVGKLVYDDLACVTALQEGKTIVTGLWVDHSFDIGMPVDPASIMYRPLRDLNGIPGAKSLIVCLTGYQRQDREDIMTMVGLMGANFSKPLVANKVTHLICYKFEGEKYELAKKMKKIKLVNHRWLEDCLRAWELLPEADYDKSGHELETMEAQAKDSEDEAEDMAKRQEGDTVIVATPQNSRCWLRSPIQDIGASSRMPDIGNTNEVSLVKEKETTPSRTQLKESPNQCFEISGSTAIGIRGKMSSGAPSNSGNISSNSVSASKIDGNSHPSSASELHPACYSQRTPNRTCLPLDIGHVKNRAGNISPLAKLQVGDVLNMSPSKIELERTSFDGEHAVSNKTPCCPDDAKISTLPEKRKIAVSGGSSKLQKKSHDSEFVLECALGVIETEMPQPTSPIHHGPHDTAAYQSPQDNQLGIDADLEPSAVNVSGIVAPKIVRDSSEQEPQTSLKKLKGTNFASKSPEDIDVISNAPEDSSNEATEPHHGPQNLNVPSPGAERLGVQNSELTANLDCPMVGDDNSRPKPLKRKLLYRKTYASKPGFGRGKVLNKKGSIFMKQKVSPEDSATRSTMKEKNEDLQRLVDQTKNVEMKSLSECGNQTPNKLGLADNETEASEDNENGLDAAVCKLVTVDTHAPNEVNTCKGTDDNIVDMIDQTVISVGEAANMEAKNAASGKKLEPGESNLEESARGEKKTSSKRCPLVETKKKKPSLVTNSKKGVKCKSRFEETKGKYEKEPLADRNMKARSGDTGKPSTQDTEQENRPVNIEGKNLNQNKKVGKVTPNSDRKHTEPESGNPDLVTEEQVLKEPAWFILSGHKLQRKEFQQVIKRLKGRLCRDTHQWSYQATHFIVPDPIRRTEKLFAAAASGRWILKTDYLTACNEAGKFLAEEPFEWHKKGLSEDGAINLEAPRKWRLLRERTGHGALYGMRIIIYGDCIVPPLDTLKRVVKAGDGTILATSPPYTRFLQSDIDFAIVSPGMPRVDIWIQEFLRHEIPCVSPDYLVEYVCKPGYSLDRHVQYNTHAWAEKSFKKLESRMNEIAVDISPQNDNSIADIPCQVCGSCDGGEVMLICGNEGGSKGCGIGTHIACCDPPLQHIPEEDWYCSKCSGKNTKKMPRKLTDRKSVV